MSANAVPPTLSDRAELAAKLRQIWPHRPTAIALARVSEVPEGVPLRSGVATSACAFWREAELAVFAVGLEHGACPIGRITQGFTTELPEGSELIGAMVETGYVDPAEVAAMPALPLGHAAIIYGPLADLPLEPEAVVIVGDPEQVMLIGEAVGAARLDGAGLTVMGRPTCAAVAAAVLHGEPRGSLACVGARIFAGFQPGELLLVVPGQALGRLAANLDATVHANATVGALDRDLQRQLVGA